MMSLNVIISSSKFIFYLETIVKLWHSVLSVAERMCSSLDSSARWSISWNATTIGGDGLVK